jgi:UDP-N-acetylmuramoylalanine--D-glutamate ligase
LEISSFQLEHIFSFKPFISVFLNITPDHLDRYSSMSEYVKAKLDMVKNQNEKDHIVYNLDDTTLNKELRNLKPQTHGFSIEKKNQTMFNVNATKISTDEKIKLIDLEELSLPGKHNLSNALAAATVSRLIGISNHQIKKIMSNFSGVEHRLEYVMEIEGVSYYNDSKATNLDSVKVALDSFDQNILLLMGGKDKGGNFVDIIPHFKDKVKKIITFGQASDKISIALRDAVRLKKVKDLRGAVEFCHLNAVPGDIVLLSPGCASFDQFPNFEKRGFEFKKLVKKIATA